VIKELAGATVADIGAKPFVQGLNRLYVARKPEPGRLDIVSGPFK